MFPLRKDVSAEHLPRSHEGSMLSLVAAETQEQQNEKDIENQKTALQALNIEEMTDEEMAITVENILLDRIKNGDKAALFQLGQLHFEQVRGKNYV